MSWDNAGWRPRPGKRVKVSFTTNKGAGTLERYGKSRFEATAAQMAAREEDGYVGSGRYARRLRKYGRRMFKMAPKHRRYGGRGDYWFSGNTLFGNAGVGNSGGGSFAARAHVTGQGDYAMGGGGGAVDNAIVGAGLSSAGIPSFAPHQSEYTMSKVEFLQDIYAPLEAGAFQNQVVVIQPGLQESFPWLGLVAPQFEEYEMRQLMYHWRPMVTDFNSGTGQCGEIIMATQYNPSDAPFTDTLRAKSYDMAMSSKTSVAMNHGVECAPQLNSGAAGKYIRVGPVEADADIKQYDLGNLNLIVSGTPSAYNGQKLGELWCSYTLTLRKPKLPVTTGSVILRDFFSSKIGSGAAVINGATPIVTWRDNFEIVYGRQNRITTLVDNPVELINLSTTQSALHYNVPTWYTGNLRLKITLLGVRSQAPPIGSGNQTAVFGYWTLDGASSSNMTQVKDLARGSVSNYSSGIPLTGASPLQPQNATQQCVWVSSANFSQLDSIIFETSIAVGPNTSGSSNLISLIYTQPSAANDVSIAGFTFDVTEYNDSFNGPAGYPELVDAQGNATSGAFA